MRTRTYLLAWALLLGTTAALQAQVPKDVQDFTSHGIHVILRSTNANKVIAAALGIQGGLAYGETDNSVVAAATAGLIAESGSDKYPKELFRDSLAKLSTSIGGGGSLYDMKFSLRTIRPSFNAAWDIFSDLLTHPHYDTTEAEKIREQAIQAIQSRESETESYAGYLVDSLWRSTSKLNRVATIPEVEALTISDVRNYRDRMFQRARMTLVVVGDVSRKEIEDKLAALDPIPLGAKTMGTVETIKPSLSKFLYVPRELPTTYVEMRTPSANLSNNDWWAERVLLQVMDKRLFDQVRTKRNLSYSPSAWATGNFQNFYGAMSYQSVLPDSAAHVFYSVIRELQTTPISKQELENAKRSRITTYYYATQSNESQANALLTDQLEFGDWRLFFKIVPMTQKVTTQQIKDVANKYFHNFTFVLIGPEGKSTREAYQFQ
jgi:predicted Zn-dependent peptidase